MSCSNVKVFYLFQNPCNASVKGHYHHESQDLNNEVHYLHESQDLNNGVVNTTKVIPQG